MPKAVHASDPRRHRRPRRDRPRGRAQARRRHTGSRARLRRRARSRQGARVARCRADRLPAGRARAVPLHADLAIECAPAAVLERICRPMLEAGKQVMVLSAGALLPRPELVELAKRGAGRSSCPTGALLRLDAVTAAAEGRIHSVRMITRKPPSGLAGALSRGERHLGRGSQRAQTGICWHRARGAAGFPPTSSWRRRCRSRASDPTAP